MRSTDEISHFLIFSFYPDLQSCWTTGQLVANFQIWDLPWGISNSFTRKRCDLMRVKVCMSRTRIFVFQ